MPRKKRRKNQLTKELGKGKKRKKPAQKCANPVTVIHNNWPDLALCAFCLVGSIGMEGNQAKRVAQAPQFLSAEVFGQMLHFLTTRELLVTIPRVCRAWLQLSRSPRFEIAFPAIFSCSSNSNTQLATRARHPSSA